MIASRVRFQGRALFLAFLFVLAPVRCRAEHRDTWTEIRSPHFTVLSNAGEHEGRRIALQFEEVRELFEQMFPQLRVDSGKITVIFALKNEDSLKLLIPSYGQNSKSMHVAGFYHPTYDKNFAVVRADASGTGPLSYRTLYHEYTHAFFHNNFRGLPVWLDEGLAELYGNTSIEGKVASVGLPNDAQLRYLQVKELLPIDQLVTIDRSSPLYNTSEHAGVFYSESWALVHYLAYSPEFRQQGLLNKFLAALHDTDDPIEAAQRTFGDLKKLSDKLQDYIRQRVYTYQRVQLPSKLSEKDFTARPISPGEATLALADYLERSGHLPEALERLHETAQLDANTPGYHSELGHYHLQKADFDAAEKELQSGIAANPKDISAHLDMAFVYLRRNGYTRETTPKIRAELESLLPLAPDFAPAYAFLSIAYAQEPDKDTDKALKCATRASKLEPGNMAYFIDVGRALVAAGRLPEAGQIADKAKKLAATPNDRNMVAGLNRLIEFKSNHPQEAAAAKPSAANPASLEGAPDEASAKILHAEGQITELLCGHPPEVIVNLATANDSLLLHVTDISKILILEGATASDASKSPCAKWKDRHVSVDYRAVASGMAKGEIQNISLN